MFTLQSHRLVHAQASPSRRRSIAYYRRKRSSGRLSTKYRLGSVRAPFGRHLQSERCRGRFPNFDHSHQAEHCARLFSGRFGRRNAVVHLLPGALQKEAGHGADHRLVQRPSAVFPVCLRWRRARLGVIQVMFYYFQLKHIWVTILFGIQLLGNILTNLPLM